MESASVPETNEPKLDGPRADGELTRAYERIKSAEEDLARLDRLVSGMEHGSDGQSASQAMPGAAADEVSREETPSPQGDVRQESQKESQTERPKRTRPILWAVVGLLLTTGIVSAAFASHYREEVRAIIARWTPGASPKVSEIRPPVAPPTVLLAAADGPVSVPAPAQKSTDDNPATGTTPPPPAELAPSLKTITNQLANITDKLEQLKSRHEQTLREQADTITQLKAAQEKDAGENARLAAQVQALQTQLTTQSTSTKPPVRSVVREPEPAARAHVQATAPPRRPPPPRGRWMPPPYMMDPYDPDW
jgi:hypothetical protein